MLYYRIDWRISSKFPPSTVFTKKQEMHGNRIFFMLKLICLIDVIKSRCKSYSSYWKCWLFKKYCGALKVKHHKHFLKRKLIQVFDDTENKWQVKIIILSIREFGELMEWVHDKRKIIGYEEVAMLFKSLVGYSHLTKFVRVYSN